MSAIVKHGLFATRRNELTGENRETRGELTSGSVCSAPPVFNRTAHLCGKKEGPQITQMDTDSCLVQSHLRRSVSSVGEPCRAPSSTVFVRAKFRRRTEPKQTTGSGPQCCDKFIERARHTHHFDRASSSMPERLRSAGTNEQVTTDPRCF